MPASDPIPAYLRRISRRLAINAGLRHAATATILSTAGFAIALLAAAILSWLGRPIAFLTILPVALLTITAVALTTFLTALFRRPHLYAAARHVDARFRLHELLESAARLPDSPPTPFHRLIGSRAASTLQQFPPSTAVPLHWTSRLSTAAACLLAFVTLALSLPQPKPAPQFAARIEASTPLQRAAAFPRAHSVPTPPPPPAAASGTQPLPAVLPPLTGPAGSTHNPTSGGTAPPTASPGQGTAESPLAPTQSAPQNTPSPPWHGLPAHEPTHAIATKNPNESPTHQPSSSAPQPSALSSVGVPPRASATVAAPVPSSPLPPASPNSSSPADADSPFKSPELMNPDIPEHARELVRQYFARD